jgi:hypothetical protein
VHRHCGHLQLQRPGRRHRDSHVRAAAHRARLRPLALGPPLPHQPRRLLPAPPLRQLPGSASPPPTAPRAPPPPPPRRRRRRRSGGGCGAAVLGEAGVQVQRDAGADGVVALTWVSDSALLCRPPAGLVVLQGISVRVGGQVATRSRGPLGKCSSCGDSDATSVMLPRLRLEELVWSPGGGDSARAPRRIRLDCCGGLNGPGTSTSRRRSGRGRREKSKERYDQKKLPGLRRISESRSRNRFGASETRDRASAGLRTSSRRITGRAAA